ncbi:DUF3068 domain-containing protein [Flexivirga sp. ID2601S]|uniref:DUF3068 domain-containing protein n=1 Tax=Flexivirga aerilata TaxID=1656889 RepID=A0A849AK17_9MICO|nr:DUF3068 domain-containing protein [Flexivirga aerilata]
MRKSAIVIGFGAFFLTMALLLKFYAYDKLAVIPMDQNTGQVAVDKNAYLFDAGTLKFQRATLTTRITAVVDKPASEDHGDNVVVFDKNQFSTIPQTKTPQQAVTERIAVDRHTGLPVNCCNDSQNGKPVKHEGYTVKFPFGVDKGKTYQYWDASIMKPMDMKYAGTDKLNGLSVYRFEGSVPRQTLKATPTKDAPGFLFGGAQDSPGVTADWSYSVDRTIWVEPETGAFIKVGEAQKQWLTNPANDKSVQVLTTNSIFDDATVKKNVDDYKTKSMQLKALKLAPWILGILGVLLLIGGVVLAALLGRNRAADRRAADDDYADDRAYDDDTVAYDDDPDATDAGLRSSRHAARDDR